MRSFIILILCSFTSLLSAQEEIPTLLQPQTLEDSSEGQRFIWRSEPGVRYELKSSADLETWTTVEGFPRFAEDLDGLLPLVKNKKANYHKVLV